MSILSRTLILGACAGAVFTFLSNQAIAETSASTSGNARVSSSNSLGVRAGGVNAGTGLTAGIRNNMDTRTENNTYESSQGRSMLDSDTRYNSRVRNETDADLDNTTRSSVNVDNDLDSRIGNDTSLRARTNNAGRVDSRRGFGGNE